ncbi:hypothetical protein C8F01DRAFT_1144005 [Mycena amicta]|nr:hypothetical protein C8F01DRAFT_1144005 [Mycena amicta]
MACSSIISLFSFSISLFHASHRLYYHTRPPTPFYLPTPTSRWYRRGMQPRNALGIDENTVWAATVHAGAAARLPIQSLRISRVVTAKVARRRRGCRLIYIHLHTLHTVLVRTTGLWRRKSTRTAIPIFVYISSPSRTTDLLSPSLSREHLES